MSSNTTLSVAEKSGIYQTCPVISAIGEVRVLQLLPGLPQDKIRCRLQKTILPDHDCPSTSVRREYEALSYTWGGGDSTTLYLNDRHGFEVTTNLEAALRRLRYQHKARTLWIDAICIDQANISERNAQVRLMGDIFSSATGVLVWLGDVLQPEWIVPSEDCIVYQTLAGEERSYRSPEVRPYGSMDISTTEEQRAALHGALHGASPHWWTRTWIVGEFCKSPANLQICYGTFEESSEDFFSSEGLLWQLVSHNEHDEICQSFWSAHYRLKDIRTKVRSGPLSILDFAENCFHADATDARDKAYSLRSMISSDEARWIEPDYHASIESVFTRATFASIVGSGQLAILRYAWPTAGRTASLPSWVVDFDDESLSPGDTIRNRLRDVKLYEALEPWTYATSSYPLVQQPGLDEESGSLTLIGRIFDSIHTFERLDLCSLIQTPVTAISSPQAKRIASLLWRLLGAHQPRQSVLLTDASKHRSRSVQRYITDVFKNWYKWSDPESQHDVDSMLEDYALYTATRDAATYTLFATSAGYLGFVRGSLEEGDIVVLFHGAPLPAVLRPVSGSMAHRFVGFAIVAFLMGEVGREGVGSLEEDAYFALV